MREGSYQEIRHGMRVQGPPGEREEGQVDEVLYDEASDIFVGLVILANSFLSEHRLLIPGERVVAVHGDRVEVDVPLRELQPYLSPAEKAARTRQQFSGERSPLDDVVV
jgi:hypothetical protein